MLLEPLLAHNCPNVEPCGYWMNDEPYAADTGLWFRMMLKHKAKKFNQVISARRMHEEQRDTQGDKIVRDYTKMVRRVLENESEELKNLGEVGVLLIQNKYSSDRSPELNRNRLEQAIKLFPPLRERHIIETPGVLRRVKQKIKRLIKK